MQRVVIVSAARTPFGRFRGALSGLSGVDLGMLAIKGALQKAGLAPAQVDEVVMGVVYQAGMKANPARQAAIKAGIPVGAPALTVNQQCASGMRAVQIAAEQIILGNSAIVVAGGMESMSNVPYLMTQAREGYRMGHGEVYDGLLYDALVCAFCNYHMGLTAENLAEEYAVSREEQDAFALASQQKCQTAQREGRFQEEIIPVEVRGPKGQVSTVTLDEHPNPDTTAASLAKIPPAFKKDGTVTAGNSSGINDGGAAMVLMSEEKAAELGLTPLAYYRQAVSVGVEPSVMGIGPVPATRKILQATGLNLEDIDLFEYNEAFAAQCLSVNRELGIDPGKINVNGGAIALGHPVGASSIRIVINLINEMRRRKLHRGLASLCAGGGPAMAIILESV